MSDYKTLKKFTDNIPNEDSCRVQDNMIAISDGAGGCGVFANEWSEYLVNKISQRNNEIPIVSFDQLDAWLDEIWEPFYNEHEEMAKVYDGIFLSKFYQEGSYATLAVVWKTRTDTCHYVTYGDSVVFHYSKSVCKFEHSFSKLSDFAKPPYLISCKDPLQREGFKANDFILEDDSVVFAASDALSHYILMMYYVTHKEDYKSEIEEILSANTSESQMLSIALSENSEGRHTFDLLIRQIQDISQDQKAFDEFVQVLHKRGVLDIDDYTIAVLKYDNMPCSIL
ncbi:MAG: hypothetical protein UE068_07225 [Paludibacteraceae bacterium]|nr:hypothetical protein [Paludibacteraceae bacterium]